MKIKIWDWWFKIFFNKDILNDVNVFIDQLENDESIIYTKIKDFYMSFYSFAILIDAINDEAETIDNILQLAEEEKQRLLKTPLKLKSSYMRKIENISCTNKQKDLLKNLLQYSLDGKSVKAEYMNLLSVLYGKRFKNIMQCINRTCIGYHENRYRGKCISSNILNTYSNTIKLVKTNNILMSRFGKMCELEYVIKLSEDVGFAEYWDRDISSSGKNELVLFVNNELCNENDFIYTIIHEIYPGHAYFYNKTNGVNKNFDHGAISLIEGWATYCEWNTLKNQYTRTLRENAIAYLNDVFLMDTNDLANRILDIGKMYLKYSDELCEIMTEYATQYIGFKESYYIGALWFEEVFDNEKLCTPKEFINHISDKKTLGEMFPLWL